MNKLPASQINDACLDLQKNRSEKGGAGCPFLDRQLTRGFAAKVLVCIMFKFVFATFVIFIFLHNLVQLSPPLDIEDLGKSAEGHCCAYYATREALVDAEVLWLMLIHLS